MVLALLQGVLNISLCKRRASSKDLPSDDPFEVSKPIRYATRSYAALAADDSSRSTDNSSGAEHDTDSFDGSDTESDSTDLMPNSEPSNIDSDSEVDFSEDETSSRRAQSRSQLNPHAAAFVPASIVPGAVAQSQQVESARSPMIMSDEASTSMGAEDADDRQPAEVVDSNTLGMLLQALSHVTPEEAGKLRAFLDDHLAAQEASCHSSSSHMAGMPFQTDLSECSSVESAPAPLRNRNKVLRSRGSRGSILRLR